MTFTPYTALLLFPAMVVLLQLGRRLRQTHAKSAPNSAIEGALFALFGLLLAFTCSGAVSRYDEHRKLIVEEANDIGTAYLRIDLLAPEAQPGLRQEFRDYMSLGIYVDTPFDVCVQRGFERDRGQDGKSDEEIKRMWTRWYEDEETYIRRDNPQHYADIVLDGTKPFAEQLVI